MIPDGPLCQIFTDFFKSLYDANKSMKMANPHIIVDQFKISGYAKWYLSELLKCCGSFKILELQHSELSDITSNELLKTYNLQTLDLLNCIKVD